MTKKEIIEAIENNESIWGVSHHRMYELKAEYIEKIGKEEIEYLEYNENYHLNLEIDLLNIYNTKAEAEHYLHHANITRTEQLPFLTWEEFNKDTLGFDFTDNIGNKYRCHIVRDYRGGEDFIVLYDKNGTISVDEEWEATEENFYKAYDECVRLFRGEE